MSTHDPQTLLLTSDSDIGSVGNYDPTVPLVRVADRNSLHAGRLYLRGTLEEMIKIRSMAKSLGENYHDLIRDTKAQYDE